MSEVPPRPQEGADEGGRGDLQPQNLLNPLNTEKSVSASRVTEIFISTSSEEADETTKLPKLLIIPLFDKVQV